VFSRGGLWGRYLLLVFASDQNSLYLIERHLVAPPVVELRGARAGVVGHGSGLLQRAAVLEVRRNAGGPETVVADLGLDAGRRSPPANHRVGVGLGQGSAGEFACAAADGPEQRVLRTVLDPVAFEIGG